jgi:putative ABC transport system permease protein
VYRVDPYYIPVLGIELVEGRNFDPANPADSSTIIVNEALVRDMGWKNPLNEHLNWSGDSTDLGPKVIGVVKDYHFASLERKIEPMFLSMRNGYLTTIMVKITAENIPAAIDEVSSTWRKLYPDAAFDYSFVDEDVARQYELYERWTNIMLLSTIFAILIACLGLFGLSGVNAINKTREIGIRKVMGANVSSIFVLLTRQYLLLSMLAFLVAGPFSYLAMERWWLSSFEERITIGWEIFALSLAGGLLLTVITVGYHGLKASLSNPAETLKYE